MEEDSSQSEGREMISLGKDYSWQHPNAAWKVLLGKCLCSSRCLKPK